MTDRRFSPGRPALQVALLALGLLFCGPLVAESRPVYENPIIHADYSDPDALRTPQGYYLTSSSFSHVPGLPILHSTDRVHWSIVNHAIRRLPPEDHFAAPRHGNGVWAPAFREHGGRYYIYYGDPDFGIYVVTAEDPAGAWSAPRLILPGKGLIDPAPFWDDDGTAWLVHAWAKSRAGFNNVITLHRLSADGLSVLDEGRVVVDGNRIEGWRTIEGPKMYKRDGFYYIFAPAGGVRNGWQGVFRSRSIEGPYAHRIVLEQGATGVNGPHQGALLTAPGGSEWFLHFQDRDVYGRIVHLQPVTWRDGWPVMGADPNGDGTGEPVLRYRAPPPIAEAAARAPQTSDAFDRGFNLAWQWQANPRAAWLADPQPAGRLRLASVPMPGNFWAAGNLLMQKFPAESFAARVRLAFDSEQPGESAGLIVFGYDYSWLGLVRTKEGLRLEQRIRNDARDGGTERIVASQPFAGGEIELRVDVAPGGVSAFSYRAGGDPGFTAFGEPFTARHSRWVGAKTGLFSGRIDAPENAAVAAFADFDDWVVTTD